MYYKDLLYKKTNLIVNKKLAGRIKTILDNANKEFWIIPASSSGKYHPPEDQGKSGLVRHTIKAVEIIEEDSRRKMFEEYEHDCAVAAIILHDIKKNGDPWGRYTDYSHGIIAAEFIQKFFKPNYMKGKIIVDAVRYHMAPWNTIFSNRIDKRKKYTGEELQIEIDERIRGMNPNRVERAVQDADYWSSRKGMSFFPGVSVVLSERHDAPEEE